MLFDNAGWSRPSGLHKDFKRNSASAAEGTSQGQRLKDGLLAIF